MENNIKRAFNRAAPTYDDHCQLQLMAGNTLLNHLATHTTTVNTIIDIGCGTGINTEKLINLFPQSNLYALDFADQLLQKAALRLTANFIEHDFDTWQGDQLRFDVIYSNLALHWSVDFPKLLNKLIGMLNANGVLAFSIPLVGTLEALSENLLVRRFYSNKDIYDLVTNSTFLVNEKEMVALHYSDSFAALKSIKGVGANFVSCGNQQGLRSKSFLDKFNFHELTYIIGYFIIRPRFCIDEDLN